MPTGRAHPPELHGWAGRILWVDLTERRVEMRETAEYVPDFIGGRGIAAKIAWDTLRPGLGAFDPDNPLMFVTGPLAGTTAPCSGRTVVAGVSPQAYPVEWYTRNGMGGHWGAELKYAG